MQANLTNKKLNQNKFQQRINNWRKISMAQTHKWQEYYEAFNVLIGDGQLYKHRQMKT